MSFRIDVDEYNQRTLVQFPLCLRQNIEELCVNGQLGLSNVSLMDISIMSSGILPSDNADEPPFEENHLLNIKVPYGGRKLSWDLLFDPEDKLQPPDFDFNDEDFLNYSAAETIIVEHIPSLVNWDLNNPKTITSVLSEFLRLYKKFNLDRLQQDNIYSRFAKEYVALTDLISPDNVEVIVEMNMVQYLIVVGVDTSVIDSLPSYCQPLINSNENLMNSGHDFIHLRVQYIKLEGSRTNTLLHLSPRLEQIFNKFRFTYLPDLTKDTSLTQYVIDITKAIEEKLIQVADYCKMRKELILYLASANATTLIEFDDNRYSYCAFSRTVDGDFSYLMQVLLSDDFPVQKPKVTVQCISCQEGKKCNEMLHNFKYSADWAVSEIVTSFMEKLPEAEEKLKAHRH